MNKYNFLKITMFVYIGLFLGAHSNTMAEDLNCMLCHKHFGLVSFDKNGKFRIHYINAELNNRSPHGQLECSDCHEGITEVPHKNVKQVDCSKQCHIDEPSSNLRYSHKPVEDLLKKSAHAKYDKNGKLKKHEEDYPNCRDCHEQPLYRSLVVMANSHESVSQRTTARCKGCHEKDYSKKFFIHVATRMQRQTNPIDRIEVCASCHGEKKFIARHKMDDVISSYKETFHYKMLRHGSERTPDCVTCHVSSGANGHMILSKKDKRSSSNPKNLVKTCKQADCHKKAGDNIAEFKTHVTYDREKYPLQYYLLLFFRIVMSVVLYSFLTIVFFELLRRLFPKLSLTKSKLRR